MRIRLGFSIALGVIILATSSFAGGADDGHGDQLCGPKCLLHVCQKTGISASLEELIALSGQSERNGTSLLGLMKAAKRKGLHAVGVKIGIDELMANSSVAIAHLWDGHFVIVERGAADDMVKIVDPSEDAALVDKKYFSGIYSGFALLVSKDANSLPNTKTTGSDMRFAEYVWDFGSVYPGEPVAHKFGFANAGNECLSIHKVNTSTSSLAAVYPTENILPGNKGQLEMILDTSAESGWQSQKVRVSSNDPITPIIELSVHGYVRPTKLKYSPQSVDWGAIRRGSGDTRRTIYVPSWSEDPVKLISVSSDSPSIAVKSRRSSSEQQPGYMIDVKLKDRAPIGPLKAKLTIRSDHAKQPIVDVPISAKVLGNIATDRESFFFGVVEKGKSAKASVIVTNVSKNALKIERIESSSPLVSAELLPRADNGGYVVIAHLNSGEVTGKVDGEITIHTNDKDQPEVKLPIYALVKK